MPERRQTVPQPGEWTKGVRTGADPVGDGAAPPHHDDDQAEMRHEDKNLQPARMGGT